MNEPEYEYLKVKVIKDSTATKHKGQVFLRIFEAESLTTCQDCAKWKTTECQVSYWTDEGCTDTPPDFFCKDGKPKEAK